MVKILNNPSGEFGYVTGKAGGWVNQGAWPNKVEQLTFEGNVVDVLKIVGDRAYIRMWHGESNDPCVIHSWSNIGNKDQVYKGGWKGPAYIVLDYPDGLWVESRS